MKANIINELTLCGKKYRIPEIGFDFIETLAENGILIDNINKTQIIPMLRVFVGYITEKDRADASKLIDAHIINGGDLDSISTAMFNALEKSRFFTSLMKQKGEADKTPEAIEVTEATEE